MGFDPSQRYSQSATGYVSLRTVIRQILREMTKCMYAWVPLWPPHPSWETPWFGPSPSGQNHLWQTYSFSHPISKRLHPINMASSCVRRGLDWTLGTISLLKGWSSIGTGCLEKWRSHHPWRCSKNTLQDMVYRHGGVGLIVGLDDLIGLTQP